MAKKDRDMMDSAPKVKISRGERIFGIFNVIILSLFTIACLYPFWYVIVASFSESNLLMSHPEALILPLGWSTKAYEYVFNTKAIWTGYANTIFYVVVGTAINIFMTLLAAYFLSRKKYIY